MLKGKYIVIEGPRGVGKTTQLELTARALRSAGLPVKIMSERSADIDNVTTRTIHKLIDDPQYPMTTRTEVLLYNAARTQTLEAIRRNVNEGVTCLVDHNYLSTLAELYYGRGEVPDYETISAILRFAVDDLEPDLTVILDAEAATLQARLDRHDKQPGNEAMLDRMRAGYLWEAKQRNLPVIYALGDREAVFKEVWKLVAVTMAQRPRTPTAAAHAEPESVADIIAHKPPLTAPPLEQKDLQSSTTAEAADTTHDEPLLARSRSGAPRITEAGQQWLSAHVTNTTGDVYAVRAALDSLTAAAAIARSNHSGDSLRITLLDEFAVPDKTHRRQTVAKNDDSIRQLVGQYLMVENSSVLLNSILEQCRLASYTAAPLHLLELDHKDSRGHYKYFIPGNLNKKTRQLYREAMDQLFNNYTEVVQKLTEHLTHNPSAPSTKQTEAWRAKLKTQAQHIAQGILPYAAKSSASLFVSVQALEHTVARLASTPLAEAQLIGQRLLAESREALNGLVSETDKTDEVGAMVAYEAASRKAVKALAAELLPETYPTETDPVSLIDYAPRNELDLVADMLYEHSAQSLGQLQEAVRSWPYDRKVKVFKAYLGERTDQHQQPGRALEKARYSWDIVATYEVLHELWRHRLVEALEHQPLTPRYGYDIPTLVEDAGLTEAFEKSFDISLKLHSDLQAAGYVTEAQYATLLGHKLRCKVAFNAHEAFPVLESPSLASSITRTMCEKLTEVHPLIAAAIKTS